MQALPGSPTSNLLLLRVSDSHLASHGNRSPNFFINSRTLIYTPTLLFTPRSNPEPSRFYSALPDDEDSDESGALDSSFDPDPEFISDDGVVMEAEKVGRNSRRIRSRIAISASLQTVWNLLTDYEKLADFIPGLAVSQLLEKRDNFARLFQIGQQNLAFGLKFNAKGIVDCYEKDLEKLPFGQRRDIEFKMIEGDFQIFEGKWSIEQTQTERVGIGSSVDEDFQTTLHYVVDVEPKLWLPVGLVEGRICREIVMNLSCIREESEKRVHYTIPNC